MKIREKITIKENTRQAKAEYRAWLKFKKSHQAEPASSITVSCCFGPPAKMSVENCKKSCLFCRSKNKTLYRCEYLHGDFEWGEFEIDMEENVVCLRHVHKLFIREIKSVVANKLIAIARMVVGL
jgi:hypothetical protein